MTTAMDTTLPFFPSSSLDDDSTYSIGMLSLPFLSLDGNVKPAPVAPLDASSLAFGTTVGDLWANSEPAFPPPDAGIRLMDVSAPVPCPAASPAPHSTSSSPAPSSFPPRCHTPAAAPVVAGKRKRTADRDSFSPYSSSSSSSSSSTASGDKVDGHIKARKDHVPETEIERLLRLRPSQLTEEERRIRKRAKNRQSAAVARQKRRQKEAAKRAVVDDLRAENDSLLALVAELRAENAALRAASLAASADEPPAKRRCL